MVLIVLRDLNGQNNGRLLLFIKDLRTEKNGSQTSNKTKH